MSSSKVSFTVRRPTPVSSRQSSAGPDSDAERVFKVPALPKHVTDSGRSTPISPLVSNGQAASQNDHLDSSDDEDREEEVDELVTGFDQFGVQRLKNTKKPKGPLVIPALANKDWREVARKRKASQIYLPAAAAGAKTGADGSVGGLGTKDTINSGPQLSGLVQIEKKLSIESMEVDDAGEEVAVETREETEDEKALRAIIQSASGDGESTVPSIDIIPSSANDFRPKTETEAYKSDVITRPDSATLQDYERVPVSEFGAALLRGMGWKPGQAASRKRSGPVKPYIPTARPALLGIGAKEQEPLDDGSSIGRNGKMQKVVRQRPDGKYMPLVKRERGGGESSGGGSGGTSKTNSRRSSRERSPNREESRRRGKEYERDKDREYERRRDRDREYESSDRDSQRDRSDRHRSSEKDGRERRRERDRDRDRDRYRDYDDSDRERRRGDRDRQRD